jgi:hypothetical protein
MYVCLCINVSTYICVCVYIFMHTRNVPFCSVLFQVRTLCLIQSRQSIVMEENNSADTQHPTEGIDVVKQTTHS